MNFPLIFGLLLALFGIATLIHLLAVSVSRRRHEIGLLKALGFVKLQVAATVFWQATAVGLIGLLVGVPVGVIAGRATWSAFAINIGVVPLPVVDIAAVCAIAASVLVVGALAAVGPAIVARHSRPAVMLHEP